MRGVIKYSRDMSNIGPFMDFVKKHGPYNGGVELGTFKDEFLCALAGTGAFRSLWGVDLWYGGYDPSDGASESDMRIAEEIAYSRLRNRNSIEGGECLRLLKRDVVKAASSFIDVSFVYIDASHRYQDIVDCICTWGPLIPDDGVLAGHDYNMPYQDDVRKAVSAVFTTEPETFQDTSWAFVMTPAIRAQIGGYIKRSGWVSPLKRRTVQDDRHTDGRIPAVFVGSGELQHNYTGLVKCADIVVRSRNCHELSGKACGRTDILCVHPTNEEHEYKIPEEAVNSCRQLITCSRYKDPSLEVLYQAYPQLRRIPVIWLKEDDARIDIYRRFPHLDGKKLDPTMEFCILQAFVAGKLYRYVDLACIGFAKRNQLADHDIDAESEIIAEYADKGFITLL